MSQIKKAALLTYIYLGVSNLVGIFMTPFIIKMLGDSEYGLFALVGAFVGYLSILDLGLTNAIVRFVANYRAQNDKEGLENFIAVSLIIYLVICVVVIGLGFGMYYNVEHFFGDSLSRDQLAKAKVMLLLFVFNIALVIPGGAFTGICNGYEHFLFPRILSLCKYLIRAGLIVAILFAGADAIGLVLLDTALNIAFIAATLLYVFLRLKVRIKLHSFNKSFLKEIFSYSMWIFLFAVVYNFQWRTGQVILGVTTNTETVAIFAVGVTLGLYFLTLGNVVNGFILPKVIKVINQDPSNEVLTTEMIKVSRMTMIVLFYILGGFIVLGQDFVLLWVGENYRESWLVALLIMIAFVIPISQGYGHAILEAKKQMRFKSLSSLIFALIGLIIGAYLSQFYGLRGIIYGIFGGLFALQIVVLFYYHFKIGLNMEKYFSKGLFPFLILFLVVSGIAYYAFKLMDNEGWLFFVLKGICYTILFLLGLYFILSSGERSYLFALFRKKSVVR